MEDIKDKKIVNILSFDGGGIRGLISTKIASYIETQLTGKFCDHFDIISGTSTGGIIALGLNIPNELGRPKYTSEDLIDIYRVNGQNIFQRTFLQKLTTCFGLFGPKYTSDGITNTTYKYFKNTNMSDSISNLLITSYGINGDCPVNFKSSNAINKPDLWNYPMYKVACATGAAPTYFNPVELTNKKGEKHLLIDGGIVRNNPAQSALAYSKELYPYAEEYHILSIGTGRTTTITNHTTGGIIQWTGDLLEYIMDGSSQSTDFELKYTFEAMEKNEKSVNSTYYRIQPNILQKDSSIDNYSKQNLQILENYANNYIIDNKEQLDKIITEYNYRYSKRYNIKK
jgi:patatin-like phospholipase/acyl hydrolase